jgi:hypothetical protein
LQNGEASPTLINIHRIKHRVSHHEGDGGGISEGDSRFSAGHRGHLGHRWRIQKVLSCETDVQDASVPNSQSEMEALSSD